MLDLVTAIRFDRRMGSGKTKPMLFSCAVPNGDEVEYEAMGTFYFPPLCQSVNTTPNSTPCFLPSLAVLFVASCSAGGTYLQPSLARRSRIARS